MKKIYILSTISIMLSLILPQTLRVDSVKAVEGVRPNNTVMAGNAQKPDFGPNVKIFDPSTPDVQSQMDEVFNKQYMNQFGSERYAMLFKPGTYDVNTNLGYYTTVSGLGRNPMDVAVIGGIGAINQNDGSGGLNNFWRGMENISISPTNQGQKNFWGVSQASPMRRVNVNGDLVLSDPSWNGYVSGGFLADSRVSGTLFNVSQQQWLTRDSQIGGMSNGVWNQVFSGVIGAPATNFPPADNPPNPYTTLDNTPESREKPYMYIDQTGNYSVFVPGVRHESRGTTWGWEGPNLKQTEGKSISLNEFFIAKPTDSAATINNALSQGLNLVFTPGVYNIDQTLNVKRNDTIIYGMGMATLIPTNGNTAIHVSDVSGVDVSGIIIDAGPIESPSLLQMGDTQGTATNNNPNTLHDVFFRVGGASAGKVKEALIVNSDYTIMDNIWSWRADHGIGVGWDINTADTGVVVNGDNVVATGYFVEHYQKYQSIWNGENGKVIMFQNEIPYDVPDQESWMNGDTKGYAAYKVSDNVKKHQAWGVGSYCFFSTNPTVHLDHAFEVPRTSGVDLYNLLTVSLNNKGFIDKIVNDYGPATDPTTTKAVYIKQYPVAQSTLNIATKDLSGNPIEGAEYMVKDDAGRIVATTKNGLIFETGELRFGTYTILQTSVPEDYKTDSVPRQITLTEGSQNQVLETYQLEKNTEPVPNPDPDPKPTPKPEEEMNLEPNSSSNVGFELTGTYDLVKLFIGLIIAAVLIATRKIIK
jgi:predicted heme/steroid binding protein